MITRLHVQWFDKVWSMHGNNQIKQRTQYNKIIKFVKYSLSHCIYYRLLFLLT